MRGRNVALGILATIVGVAVLVGIVIAGYQLNWWLKGNAVNRTAKINRTSYEVQQTYREEVLHDMENLGAVDAQLANPAYASMSAELHAQRISIVRTACDHISRLTTSGAGTDPDVVAFHDKECIQ